MKVNCLSCGHTLDLGDAYDDYQGQIRCYVCGSLLAIKTEEGKVKSAQAERAAGAVAEAMLAKAP